MQQEGRNNHFNQFRGFHGDDFFNSFFNHGSGGGGGGGGFHFNFDDEGGHRQHQQQMHPDLYENCDVIKLDNDNYIKF